MPATLFTRAASAAALCSLGLLTACAGFFVDSTTTTTTTSSGDYVYVVNSTTNTLNEYVAGSGALTAVSGSPITLTTGLAARSVTVTRPGSFVYVGGNDAIDCYSIGTGGALTAVTAGNVSAVANFVSLDTSPDGNWLIALDASGGTTGTPLLYVYGINTSTGVLTLTTSIALNVNTATTTLSTPQVKVSPAGTSILASLNAAGTSAYAFNTSTGAVTYEATYLATGFYDQAVAYSSTGAYAYVARASTSGSGSGITSYAVASNGTLTAVQALASSGTAPSALTFDSTGTYLYDANAGDLTLGAYTSSSGTLTALASSPFSSGVKVVGLARDNSGKYVVAIGSTGTNDVTLYAFDAFTAGKLNPIVSVSTGSAGVVAVAATRKTSDF